MSNRPQTLKTIGSVSFIVEKSLTVVLMFLINFLPRFWNRGEPSLKRWGYKASLATYVLQNSLIALIGSTTAAYKVLTIPEPEPKANELKLPGAKSVVDLMLLITNYGFRYFVAEFFLTKLFDKELDILGGKTIEESMGVQILEGPEHDDHGSASHRMNVTPTQELDGAKA
ncbi:Hypothetical predicted protein [Paramuricea clavata]|uniref:Uncharacterized protein n=1 Tax=Paramuricea clavata TaxID=317549 RepID=A0A6S7IZI5_PARCT|nr:Hypothetical predicted protein [Paramuricea clavata]